MFSLSNFWLSQVDSAYPNWNDKNQLLTVKSTGIRFYIGIINWCSKCIIQEIVIFNFDNHISPKSFDLSMYNIYQNVKFICRATLLKVIFNKRIRNSAFSAVVPVSLYKESSVHAYYIEKNKCYFLILMIPLLIQNLLWSFVKYFYQSTT